MLEAKELERYARHIVLREVGGPGQAKLKAARVLVVGAGGLGAPVLLYLAAAGVGTLGVIDDDKVSLSNLQRQVILGTPDIGAREGRERRARRSRGSIRMSRSRRTTCGSTAANALDLIVRVTTSSPTARTISPRAISLPMPAISRRSRWSPPRSAPSTARSPRIRAHETRADGRRNPTYRCLFPEAPPPGTVPACAEAGILGALPGVLGSLMALEVIREIVGFGEGLVGRLLMVDARSMRFETLSYDWDPANPLSGDDADDQGFVTTLTAARDPAAYGRP